MNFIKNKWIILSFILIIFGIIVFNNFLIKPTIWSDEGLAIQLGRNLAETGNMKIAISPNAFSSHMYYYTSSAGWVLPVSLAGMFKIFGVSFFNARFLMALYLFGFIAVVFLLVCRLWGLKMAVLSSLLLISFAPLYGNGKSVLADMPGLFWLVFGLYFFEFFREKPFRQAVFAGVGFGMFFASKPSFLLLGLPVLAVVHLVRFFRKKISYRWLAVFWLIILAAVLPTVWLGIIHPVNFENLEKTLSHYSNNYYSPCVSCDIRSNLALFLTHQTLWHLGLLLIIAAVYLIFINRGAFKDWRIQWLAFFALFDLFYFIKSPGTFRYFFPLQLILLIIFPICFLGLFKKQKMVPIFYLLITFLIGAQFIHLGWFKTMYSSNALPILERYVQEEVMPTGKTVGIIGAPAGAATMPSGRYYQFIQFVLDEKYGIVDGVNPLGLPDEELPNYLIYQQPLFIFQADIEMSLKRIDAFYKKAAVFRDYVVVKLQR